MAQRPSEPPDIDVAADEVDGVLVLTIRGEVDTATASVLDERLAAIDKAGPVVLDMSDVRFMDSNGLRVLVLWRERLEADGRRFAIACRPDGELALLFEVTGTDRIFRPYPSREEALAALSDGT